MTGKRGIEESSTVQLICPLVLAVLAVVGQGAAQTTTEPSTPPQPPGRLVDVDGHKMHIHITGHGGPTVVLEAGAGAFSFDWELVQTEIAKAAQVCSYDRAGHAWSELGPRPHTHAQAAHDLHELLRNAGVERPLVLVGHSMGGALVRVYQSRYPQDVAGMVLVESPPELMAQYVNGKMVRPCDLATGNVIPSPRDRLVDSDRVLAKPELDGVAAFRKAMGPPVIDDPYTKLPREIQILRLWAMAQPAVLVGDYNEYGPEESMCLFADRVRQAYPLGKLPLVVLTRAPQEAKPGAPAPRKQDIQRDRERIEGCRALAAMSSNSLFRVAHSSVHELQLDEPVLVVNAIKAVLDSARTGAPLRALD